MKDYDDYDEHDDFDEKQALNSKAPVSRDPGLYQSQDTSRMDEYDKYDQHDSEEQILNVGHEDAKLSFFSSLLIEREVEIESKYSSPH